MQLFLHTILFSENLIRYVKEASHFSMLEAKLWHNKTEIKTVKVSKMVGFIRTCDQYPHRINFDNFFNSMILILPQRPIPASPPPPTPPFCWGKNRSPENAVWEEWKFPFCVGGRGVMIKTWGRVLLWGISKNEQIEFFDSQM